MAAGKKKSGITFETLVLIFKCTYSIRRSTLILFPCQQIVGYCAQKLKYIMPEVLGQFSPRKITIPIIAPQKITPWMIAPRIIAPRQLPPREIVSRKIVPQTISLENNCP